VFEDDIGSRNLYEAECVRADVTKTNNYLLAATGATLVKTLKKVKVTRVRP
jgi:hypothetical protein